jgi:hypothetical protein
MDQIESLESFAHGQAHWIDDLRGQVSELRGEPIPSSVLLSPSPEPLEEVADDEAEAEEEAEVRTLVEAPAFQEVEGLEFTTPSEENEDPLPIVENLYHSSPRRRISAERRASSLDPRDYSCATGGGSSRVRGERERGDLEENGDGGVRGSGLGLRSSSR